MPSTFIVTVLLIGNFVSSQTDRPSEIKSLSDTESVFPLQIQTTEKTLAATTGNNPNPVTPAAFTGEQKENFRAILPTHFIAITSAGEKMKSNQDDGSGKLLLSPVGSHPTEHNEETFEYATESSLYWDNCLDKMFKYSESMISEPNNDFLNAETITSNTIPSNINKRDSLRKDYSIINAILDKYNNFMYPKADVATTDIDNTMNTDRSTTNPSTTVRVIPITEIIFGRKAESFNQSFDNTVTDNSVKGINENRVEPKDKSKIKFSRLPQTQTYLIPKFKLGEGFHPFTFMSKFFSVIYPFEYPIGPARDIVSGKFSFPYSFLQSIKLESTFLIFIITFACLAIIIPVYLIILCILAMVARSKCTEETESGALFADSEQPDCHYKMLIIFTFLVVILCCIIIAVMFISNEQSRIAVNDSYAVISCACTDLATWLSTAAQELHNSLVPPMDVVLYAYKEDLRNIENLLGEPIKQSIASESGIDLVLDSLNDIIKESEDLSAKVSSLRDDSIKAGLLAAAAAERITDLAQQLDSLKKHCVSKDAPLCDTLNTNSLQLMMKFDSILREDQLLQLRSLGVQNLTQEIQAARKEFRTLPSAIYRQTERVRNDVLRGIESHKTIVNNSSRVLSDIVRHLGNGLRRISRQMDGTLHRLQKYEFWRWTFTLACTVAVAVVMLLILLAMLCGCGSIKTFASKTLQVTVFWLCIISIILWCTVSMIFLIAGHAEVFACEALWDSPRFRTLTALLDKPSALIPDGEGIFDILFKELDNVTINVPIKDVLRECERNQPAYNVFQLEKILDVNKETSYFEWDELQSDLKRLSSAIDVGFLKTISANFNRLLNRIHVISDVNLTQYRMEYNGPVVGKDLPSFVDQLENVAIQVTDLTTAGRLESLATRTQRLHLSSIKPLEQLRTELVFKLTELELQMTPFRRKLNISLSHIHTAQFYIDNQGDVIAQKKVAMFISRLISHAAGWRTLVLTAAERQAGRCGPLFTVFAALRSLLCTQYISPLHGWWFCGFLLGFIWCTFLTPLCVKLWRAYGRKTTNELEALTMAADAGEPGTPATATCDNNWTSPEPPPPPRNDSW
ncbi:prominin-1-A isoform X2 [Aricia agestis]|uniref:prominin-1-A isoform X2 n=1 Tax=Aricia agestis TaxID=91739 RepID=UPI001C2037E6|nr:prominin-1-A isoform X2 [Aricia agestis]